LGGKFWRESLLETEMVVIYGNPENSGSKEMSLLSNRAGYIPKEVERQMCGGSSQLKLSIRYFGKLLWRQSWQLDMASQVNCSWNIADAPGAVCH
jgi:hypothetical protein